MFEHTTRIAALVGVMACLAGPVQAQEAGGAEDPARVELARKHYELAEAYKAQKAYDEAVAAYLKAYEILPRPSLLFNVAQAYWLAGQHEQALAYYQRYLDVEPRGAGAQVAREQFFHAAEVMWGQGRHDQALAWYARYLELDPGGAYEAAAHERYFDEAERVWQGGDLDGALAGYARYLELAPEGARAAEARERFFAVAERHDGEGEQDRALAGYERYLELAPQGASAEAARARIAAIHAARAAREREAKEARARAQQAREQALRAAPPPVPAEAPRVEARGGAAVQWSGVVHAAFDYQARGAAAVAGVGLGLGRVLEVRAAGVVGPTLGAYVGGVAHMGRVGAFEPVAGMGVPIFFDSGVRLGIRGSLGVEWAAMERVSGLVELAAEHYFNAQWDREATVLVPLVGVRARL